MATVRKTAAQKRAEAAAQLAAQNAAEWIKFTAEYPARFAAVLYFYASTGNGFEVNKLDADTYIFKHDERMWRQFVHLKVTAPVNYTRDYMDSLDEVERLMKDYLAEQAEQARRYEVRQAALSKARDVFSAEERELLGL